MHKTEAPLDVAASCVNRVKIIGRFPSFSFHVIYTHKTECPLEGYCTAVSATLFVAKIVFSRDQGVADIRRMRRISSGRCVWLLGAAHQFCGPD